VRHLPHQQQAFAVFFGREALTLLPASQARPDKHSPTRRPSNNAGLPAGSRKSMLRNEHVLEHGAFEFRVVGDKAPARIARCFEKRLWYRLPREPSLHLCRRRLRSRCWMTSGRRMRGIIPRPPIAGWLPSAIRCPKSGSGMTLSKKAREARCRSP
jgi:hypothetical protein